MEEGIGVERDDLVWFLMVKATLDNVPMFKKVIKQIK